MKKIIINFVMIILVFTLSSCAKFNNKVARDGSFFGSTSGDWLVIKQSGGYITDVYKLENVMVQSEEHSDGWLFSDECGNMINISGDCKATRVTDRKCAKWDLYIDYHMEFDSLTYNQRYFASR